MLSDLIVFVFVPVIIVGGLVIVYFFDIADIFNGHFGLSD